MSFSFFRKQIKTLLEREANIPEQERSCFSWQFMYTNPHTDTNYLVGKGGSHTCFWIVNPTGTDKDERHTCLPMDLLDVMQDWGKQKYDFYGIGRNPRKFKRFSNLDKALKCKAKHDPKLRLFGVTKDGNIDILYKQESLLAGGYKWINI